MKRCAVVVNPTKRVNRAPIDSMIRDLGWAPPLWLETTADDPGRGQALQALAEGVELIIALGGDGTVRCVADGMVGSGVPLGIVPAGTGNLLARNLNLPHRRATDALRVALTGRTREIDTLAIELDRDGDGVFEDAQTGVVIVGIGLDAEIMDSTSESLKQRASWLAYPLAGVQHANAEPTPMTVAFDGGPTTPARPLTAVLVGNCGRLQGGVRLMPEAEIDDGILNTVVVAARRTQWVRVLGKVLTRSTTDSPVVQHRTSTTVTVRCDRPTKVEIDGDVRPAARALRVTVRPRSLKVRVR
ncbi:diacylglycerol/lipid kinase family protein [Calidifontibacter terrae]